MKKTFLLALIAVFPMFLSAAKVTMENGTVINCKGSATDVAKAINSCTTTLCCCQVLISDPNETIPWDPKEECFNPKKVSTVTIVAPTDPGGPGRNPIFIALGLLAIAMAIYFKKM